MIRAATVARLEEVREKVLRCFEAGALASGAALTSSASRSTPTCATTRTLAALYAANLQALGRSFEQRARSATGTVRDEPLLD